MPCLSSCFLTMYPMQVGVLQWFARLWEIDQDDYWGYITNCGTEGNLHGILVGRENLPDGVLYASHETHYSVFKAARMYRMDSVKVCPFMLHIMSFADVPLSHCMPFYQLTSGPLVLLKHS